MLRYLFSGNIVNALLFFLSSLIIIFLVTPFHEFSHAFVANKLGDDTAKYQGRLTVNPFAQIDWIGAALIMLFGFGWAKPVPINPNNFRYTKVGMKGGMALTALAGPVANLLAAFVFLIIANAWSTFMPYSAFANYVYIFLFYVIQINICLAVFNFIPVPPLDGSKILFAILPTKYYFGYMRYERYILIILILLVFSGVLSTPLYYVENLVYTGLNFIAALPFSFFN